MLPLDLESIWKMLVRGTYKQIAHATWKNVNLKKHLVEFILKEVEKEAIGLCSKKHPSILRMTDKESMLNLSMDSISLELKDRAPLIHSTLSTIAINRNSRASSDCGYFAKKLVEIYDSSSVISDYIPLSFKLDGKYTPMSCYYNYFSFVMKLTFRAAQGGWEAKGAVSPSL